MDAVAIIATISAGVVALVSTVVNGYIAWLQRGQALELAEKTHAHEREIARGTRLFDRRAAVYEEMLRLLFPVVELVEATEPIMSFSGDPPPPELPSPKDRQEMLVKLRTYGSVTVADAYQELSVAVGNFFLQVPAWQRARDRSDDPHEGVRAGEALREARMHVREKLRGLERDVSQELEAL